MSEELNQPPVPQEEVVNRMDTLPPVPSRFGLPQDHDLTILRSSGEMDGGWQAVNRKDAHGPNGEVVDVVIVKKPAVDEEGNPLLDEKGNRQEWGRVVSYEDLMRWQQPKDDTESSRVDAEPQSDATEIAEMTNEAADDQPEQTEAEAEQAETSDLEALKTNPNKLLEAGTLHAAITDPTKLLPAGTRPSGEIVNTLGNLMAYANREVVAPEAAAQISQEFAQRSMAETQQHAVEAGTMLTDVESQMNNLDSVHGNLDQQLYALRTAIGNLQNNLDQNFRYLDEGAVHHYAGVIRDFESSYQQLMTRRKNALEEGTDKGHKVGAHIETGAANHESTRNMHRSLTDEALQSPEGVEPTSIVDAVAKRGARDIAEHKDSAIKDIDRDMATLQETAKTYGDVSANVRGLTANLTHWAKESQIAYPHLNQIGPVIEEINRQFNMMFHGSMPNKYRLQEMLQELEGRASQIQHASHRDSEEIGRTRGIVRKIRDDLTKLGQQPAERQ